METAIIASLTSLAISIFTFIQFRIGEKRQRDHFNKSLRREVTDKLINLRMEHYPMAFSITDEVRKKKGGNFNIRTIQNSKRELVEWKRGVVRMIISEESHGYLLKLLDAMGKDPALGDVYASEQVEKIWNSRNRLRNSLRNDIGLLHTEDENTSAD